MTTDEFDRVDRISRLVQATITDIDAHKLGKRPTPPHSIDNEMSTGFSGWAPVPRTPRQDRLESIAVQAAILGSVALMVGLIYGTINFFFPGL